MKIQQENVRPTRAKISTQNTLNTFLSIQLAVEATDSVFVLAIDPLHKWRLIKFE